MIPKTKQRVAHVLHVLRGLERIANARVEFTAADLMREFRDLSEENAAEIVKLAKGARGASDLDSVMSQIDKLLETHGVEAIDVENSNNGRYWGDTVALYCNSGDPYVATVIFDIAKETFLLTDYASVVEQYDRS
jgi:hypothetical protein